MTPNANSKKSYADTAKQGIANGNGTPKSSRPKQAPSSSKAVLTGTSSNVIGKPISPSQLKRNDRPNKQSTPEKAIWVSRIHRETTAEELDQYVKTRIGITTPDISVHKLVKKDRDISSYSFVSFRITCSAANFATLINPMYWPSNSQIREFDLERKSSVGVKLNQESNSNDSEPKNEEPPMNATMDNKGHEPQQEPQRSQSLNVLMETDAFQVTH